MPSNAELRAAIANRAAVLDLTVNTDGMNNATLAATLKGLNETLTPAEAQAAADAQAAPARSGYFVAKGKSITSPRGILAEGEEVRDGDVTDEARDVLVGLEVVEKR